MNRNLIFHVEYGSIQNFFQNIFFVTTPQGAGRGTMAQNALERSRAKTISSTGKPLCMWVEIIPGVCLLIFSKWLPIRMCACLRKNKMAEKNFSNLKIFFMELDRPFHADK